MPGGIVPSAVYALPMTPYFLPRMDPQPPFHSSLGVPSLGVPQPLLPSVQCPFSGSSLEGVSYCQHNVAPVALITSQHQPLTVENRFVPDHDGSQPRMDARHNRNRNKGRRGEQNRKFRQKKNRAASTSSGGQQPIMANHSRESFATAVNHSEDTSSLSNSTNRKVSKEVEENIAIKKTDHVRTDGSAVDPRLDPTPHNLVDTPGGNDSSHTAGIASKAKALATLKVPAQTEDSVAEGAAGEVRPKSTTDTAADGNASRELERSIENNSKKITGGVDKLTLTSAEGTVSPKAEASLQRSNTPFSTPQSNVRTIPSTPTTCGEDTQINSTTRGLMRRQNVMDVQTPAELCSPMTPGGAELQSEVPSLTCSFPQSIQQAGSADSKTNSSKKHRGRRGRRRGKGHKKQDETEGSKETSSLCVSENPSKEQSLPMQQLNPNMNIDEANIEGSGSNLVVNSKSNVTVTHSSLQSDTYGCAAKDLHA